MLSKPVSGHEEMLAVTMDMQLHCSTLNNSMKLSSFQLNICNLNCLDRTYAREWPRMTKSQPYGSVTLTLEKLIFPGSHRSSRQVTTTEPESLMPTYFLKNPAYWITCCLECIKKEVPMMSLICITEVHGHTKLADKIWWHNEQPMLR